MWNSDHFLASDPDSTTSLSVRKKRCVHTTPKKHQAPEGWHSLLQVRDRRAAGKLTYLLQMEVSIVMGVSQNRWYISWKISSRNS